MVVTYTCPPNHNWTLSGATCTREDCSSNQVRAKNGSCIAKTDAKDTGAPSPSLCIGNPVNAGTGGKFHSEGIYAVAGESSGFAYALSYQSRPSSSQYHPANRHGLFWFNRFDRSLSPDGTLSATTAPAAVYATRPDGQLIDFRLVSGAYKPDADITHKLIRKTDPGGATSGWQITGGEGDELETYDATGRFVSLTDVRGRVQTLGYDANGRLATITDGFGHTLTLANDAQNRVISLTQLDGQTVGFAYSAANNLTTITWPGGATRTYHYENTSFPNNLTGITDENGARFATYSYDTSGRANLTEHANGAQRATLSFGTNSTTVTDAVGTSRTYTLTTVLNVVRGVGSNQPSGSGCGPASSALSYDGNGNVASRTDFNGVVTSYTYDLSRNLETQRIE
ncbi:MAG: hypothetical protein ABIK82_03350, partial [Pseudomonadota bacterium]